MGSKCGDYSFQSIKVDLWQSLLENLAASKNGLDVIALTNYPRTWMIGSNASTRTVLSYSMPPEFCEA